MVTKLIVGLGNPGPEYRATRHNAGFSVVAEVARQHHVSPKPRATARVGRAIIAGETVVLAQPTTMMNLSGRAVAALRRADHISNLADLLVVYDDMDLPLGAVRLRERGGSGGHRGMQSINEAVGGQDFARLRVGIGRPAAGQDPIDYVLTRFSVDEEATIDRVIRVAADAVECWIQYGPSETMNRFNPPTPPNAPRERGSESARRTTLPRQGGGRSDAGGVP